MIRAKIGNQAKLLRLLERPGAERLEALEARVRSGDADNRESVAARAYWRALFGTIGFVRNPDGEGINVWLNYGYALLRAACARALVSSGLHCALGLHHRNRYNAFALADDIMEPYRPYVDRQVFACLEKGMDENVLNREVKAELLRTLSADTRLKDKTRPLLNALSLTSASLCRCFAGEDAQLVIPE